MRFWYYVGSPRDLDCGANANNNNMTDDDTLPDTDGTNGARGKGAAGTQRG